MEWLMLFTLVALIVVVGWRQKVGKLTFTSAALHRQELFWAATAIPFIFSLVLSFPLFVEHWWQWQFDSDGYGEFVRTFAFPISILSISIILGVTVARFHHSYQRDIQIKETEKRNIAQYYQEHRKYIIEKLKEEIGDIGMSSFEEKYFNSVEHVIRYSLIYEAMFPMNRLGTKVEVEVKNESLSKLHENLLLDRSTPCEPPKVIEHSDEFYRNFYRFKVDRRFQTRGPQNFIRAVREHNERIALEIESAVILVASKKVL